MNKIVLKMNNNLFGKGKEKILACFYKNRHRALYFSEILRETKLTQNTTLKHLKNLQNNKLITSTKKIGNTFYQINPKNPQIYFIFSYFDYKRFDELPSERKRAILDFLNKLEVKPLIALVFGSTAKGTFGRESDIDILLVFNKKEAQDKRLRADIEAVTGVKIQTFVIDFNYFNEQMLKEEDKVIIHAVKTGFVITGFDLFYGKILNG